MGLFANIMIVNTFQVVVSLAYVAYNGLVSCMLVADEWCRFAKDRKTLRVSAPIGMQRSSYTLSMPFRYGIPMMIFFSFQHWLVSQGMFIVRLNKFNEYGIRRMGWTFSGYSFIPCLIGKKRSTRIRHFANNILKAVNLAFLFFIVQFIHACLRKYPGEDAMPLASTCSAAISAACHRPEADKEAHLLPVKWGVVGTNDRNMEYCSFTTSRDVVAPSTGSFYLGISSSSEGERLLDQFD
jgi:hypothetical protein